MLRIVQNARLILRIVTAMLLLAGASLFGQSYRGVQVGQRADFLPADFSEVKNGEYAAQFGIERMQVFVNGALVTGFTVTPLVPLTLAEAIAKFGSIPDTRRMFVSLDPDGDPQGLVDPVKRISYLTRSLGPDGVVSSVGYYDDNTALLIWRVDANPSFLDALEKAAKHAELQNLNTRRRLASVAANARQAMEEILKAAHNDVQQLTTLLSRYQQSCSGGATSACQSATRAQYPPIAKTAERIRFAVKRANDLYSTNAETFNNTMPLELTRLNQTAERLLAQVPVAPPGLQ